MTVNLLAEEGRPLIKSFPFYCGASQGLQELSDQAESGCQNSDNEKTAPGLFQLQDQTKTISPIEGPIGLIDS